MIVVILLAASPIRCAAHPVDLVVVKLSLAGGSGEGLVVLQGSSDLADDSSLKESMKSFDITQIIGELTFRGAPHPCTVTSKSNPAKNNLKELSFSVTCPEIPKGGSITGSSITLSRPTDILPHISSDLTTIFLLSVDGTRYSATISRAQPHQVVQIKQSGVFSEFFNLGLHHIGMAQSQWYSAGKLSIPEGIDHILFVLTLVLSSQSFLSLIKTVTGFTIGHSITLVTTTLLNTGISSDIVEPAIAASIAFMAIDVIRKSPRSRPWIPAFLLGLLHGCGFAAVLIEQRLEGTALFSGLLGFNLGVEVGQLIFVTIFCGILAALFTLTRSKKPVKTLLALSIFLTSVYWFFERF